ncbi:hypothetical protein CHH77_05310 [Shouchella clausii]|nr:hypothetical protein [Shouchella clausii]PAD18582.1 hypothetical protein CHH73_05935 [Shouchella clausii]PAD46966.1 hypothetical protein CHI09_10100 [Shouchella clausii]PAE84073.1 hypothetical protein CHH77_05310 [Shouchella clausii]PAE88205.1 hypothetical protein CHH72_15285 [Shouchella clausii]
MFMMLKQVVHKHWLPFSLGAASFALLLGTFIILGEDASNDSPQVANPPNATEVLRETVFADGNIRTERVEETIWAIDDFWAEYEEWQLVDQSNHFVHFRKTILDLSPEVKEDGYLGIDADRGIVLYTGAQEAGQIVTRYSEIEAAKLSESDVAALEQGIRIESLEHLQNLLAQWR